MAALLSSRNRRHRQGGAVHQRGARTRDRGAAARRERVGLQVHRGGRAAHPLRPGRGAQRRARARSNRSSQARTGRPLHVPRRFRAADRPPALQQAGDRIADRRRARATRSTGIAPSSSPRSTRRWARRSCASRSATRARSPSSATRPRRPAGGTALPDVPPWTEAERLARGEGGHRVLHLGPSAGPLPRGGRALRHPHHRHARANGASTR